MQIVPPTTGRHIGPGKYLGAESTLVVKEPEKKSTFFMRPRKLEVIKFQESSTDDIPLKTFQEENFRGITFEESGKGGGNVHLLNWTKSKIEKVYPKLAKQKWPVIDDRIVHSKDRKEYLYGFGLPQINFEVPTYDS